jgi:hypothetical protein
MNAPQRPTDLARLLQAFFCQHLMAQRGASRQTVNGYRDTFQGSVEFGRNSLASGMICRGVDFRPEMPYKGGHDRYRLRNLQLPVGPCAAC